MKELDFLRSSMQVKDRLLIEMMIVMTTNKIKIPDHILNIVIQLYPNKMEALERLMQEIESNERSKEENREKKENSEEKPETENENSGQVFQLKGKSDTAESEEADRGGEEI